MAAKFVLEKDPSGQFRFRLMSQGRVLSSSGAYSTKRAAQNAIASVQTTAPKAKIDDTTQASTPSVAKVAAKKVAKSLESVVKTPRRRAASTAKALVAAAVPSTRKSAAAATGPGRTATVKAASTVRKAPATKPAAKATKAPAAKPAAKATATKSAAATPTASKAPATPATAKAPATRTPRARKTAAKAPTTAVPATTAPVTTASVAGGRAPRKARKA